MTLAGGLRLIVSQRLMPSADGTGLVAAAEVLPGSVALGNLIRDNKTYQIPSLQQRGKALGIVRFDDSLAELVRGGQDDAGDRPKGYAESPDELEAAGDGQARRRCRPEPPPLAGRRASWPRWARCWTARAPERTRPCPRIAALFDKLLDKKGSDLHLGIGYPPLGAHPRRAHAAARGPAHRRRDGGACSSSSPRPSRSGRSPRSWTWTSPTATGRRPASAPTTSTRRPAWRRSSAPSPARCCRWRS